MPKKKSLTPENKLVSNDKYLSKLSDIKIRVPKVDKEKGIPDYRKIIQDYAELKHMTTNQLVITLINEAMKKDNIDTQIPNGISSIMNISEQNHQ